MLFATYLQLHTYSKIAIVLCKNGHFVEMVKWSWILEKESNSTTFYLIFDTHDRPGSVFIWKWKIYSHQLLVCSSFLLIFEISKNGTDWIKVFCHILSDTKGVISDCHLESYCLLIKIVNESIKYDQKQIGFIFLALYLYFWYLRMSLYVLFDTMAG